MSMLRVDLSGLSVLLEEMGDDAELAARPAAQAAAQVLYEQVIANAQRVRKSGKLASAVYQVYSEDNSGPGRATYHISWNHRKAPHGHLVEFGHIQRYKSYVGSDGQWYTAIRPNMQGKRRPPRSAPQAVKDAYYVPLTAPKQIAAQSFVRSAVSAFPSAMEAAQKKLLQEIV